MDGIGKGYRKGVLCVEMWGCVLHLRFGGEGGKLKGLQKGVFMCCNVVMCAVVTGWVEREGIGKGYRKGFVCAVMW